MRLVESVADAGEFVVLQDALGRVCQQVPGGEYEYRDDKGKMQFHRREAGWWDMRMERRVDPSRIAFPARVVWERMLVGSA